MRSKQPKFRVGQVVRVIGSESFGQIRKVIRVDPPAYDIQLIGCFDEEMLRSLTAREIGPRPARRKGKGK